MPLQLMKTTNEHYEIIGNGATQILIEGDIIVPDIKPDIASVLKVCAKPVIHEEKPGEDKVSFKGGLHVDIIYIAKKAEKAVHSIHDTLHFEDVINIDGVSRLNDIQLTPQLSHLEYKVINDRKIGVKAILTVTACAWGKKEREHLQGAQASGLQVKEGEIVTEKLSEMKKDRFIIKESFNLPSVKAEMEDIITCQVNIINKELKVVNGGVNIKGEALISLIYTGSPQESVVESVEFTAPFNGTVEINDAQEGMKAKAVLVVEKVEPYILPDDNGEDRVLDVEITVYATAMAIGEEKIPCIEDVYSTEEILELEQGEVEKTMITGKTQANIALRETLTLEKGNPDIMQVVKAWGSCYVDNVVATENAVVLEGGATIEVMYIVQDDDSPVEVVEFMVPFEETIALTGAKSGSNVVAECELENVLINMLTGREIEANITLVIDAEVSTAEKVNVISNIKEVNGTKKHVPSAVIYVVQKGDTLWKIAKKYGTTVENILMVNDIENPDLIYPCEKLLILRCCK